MAFDLEVHKRNGKGQIYSTQPYRLVIENGVSRFERPVGSGNWYDAGGTLVKKAEEPKAEPKAEAKPAEAKQGK